MSASTQVQINFDILYVQPGMSSVGVWYNLPGEGTPKGLQSRVNVRFMETGQLILLSGTNLVQGKWQG